MFWELLSLVGVLWACQGTNLRKISCCGPLKMFSSRKKFTTVAPYHFYINNTCSRVFQNMIFRIQKFEWFSMIDHSCTHPYLRKFLNDNFHITGLVYISSMFEELSFSLPESLFKYIYLLEIIFSIHGCQNSNSLVSFFNDLQFLSNHG